MFRKIALAGALALATLGVAGCSTSQVASFNSGLTATTTNLVSLNNALIQVNNTIVGNLIAQAKLLAPYDCGTYALASAILNDSSAAAKVNGFIAKNVAANVSSVAVKDICATLGYPTTVTAAPAAPAAPATGS